MHVEATKELTLMEGTVESVIFRNEENGYTVLRLSVGDGEPVTVVGCMPGAAPGEGLAVQGTWGRHSSYGEQFKAEIVERRIPVGEKAIFEYLASGAIKGVGAATARRLVEEFGSDTFNVLEEHPEQLTKIKGITRKRALQIGEAFRLQMGMRRLLDFLGEHGLPLQLGMPLYRRYGDLALDVIRDNPYLLVDEELGVSFSTADELALAIGLDGEDPQRLEAGILFELTHNLNNGHTFLPVQKLLWATGQLIGVEGPGLTEALDSLEHQGLLTREEVAGEDACYLSSIQEAEEYVAWRLEEMCTRELLPPAHLDRLLETIQAKYEQYLLGTAFARPIIAKRLVEIAKKEGADAICHGCTGKGNDQVRFELAIKRFAPEMKIIAPWREWDIKGRDEEIDYAEAHNIPLKISRETNYSKDKNLWHLSHEGLDLEDPSNEPQYEKEGFLEMGVSPIAAPDKPTYVTLEFVKGVPVAIDGEKMKASDIIRKLNKLGGENGIGLLDIVENRLVGMKDRGVYETPGGTILYHAHEVLEMITIDKDTAHMKAKLAVDFADLVYNGKWFTPLREALSAFADKTQEHVTGTVKLKLYKGNIINAGVTSPETLYSEDLVTFEESDYDQKDSAGFINLWGLPDTVQALREQGKLK